MRRAILVSLLATARCAEAQACGTPMRIAVLGATGGVGAHVVRLALEQGHTVLAYVDTYAMPGGPNPMACVP